VTSFRDSEVTRTSIQEPDPFSGGWEMLAREPMLRSRIYRRVILRPLSSSQVLEMVSRYHRGRPSPNIHVLN